MPTEAEWEYACRAGTSTEYCFGDSNSGLDDYAWYAENADDIDEKYAHRVAQKKPNAFGLFDMHGNVWEWCQDCYADYDETPRDGSAYAAGSSLQVVRGGSWSTDSGDCRSAFRGMIGPGMRDSNFGFRPACSFPLND